MILILYGKDLVNGSRVSLKRFKPQIIEKSKLSSIRKREEAKNPGHEVFFRYVELPKDNEINVSDLKNILKDVKQ